MFLLTLEDESEGGSDHNGDEGGEAEGVGVWSEETWARAVEESCDPSVLDDDDICLSDYAGMYLAYHEDNARRFYRESMPLSAIGLETEEGIKWGIAVKPAAEIPGVRWLRMRNDSATPPTQVRSHFYHHFDMAETLDYPPYLGKYHFALFLPKPKVLLSCADESKSYLVYTSEWTHLDETETLVSPPATHIYQRYFGDADAAE